MVAHFPDTEGVTSSNLVSPTSRAIGAYNRIRVIGAAASALPSHGRGRRFDSYITHRCSERPPDAFRGPLAFPAVADRFQETAIEDVTRVARCRRILYDATLHHPCATCDTAICAAAGLCGTCLRRAISLHVATMDGCGLPSSRGATECGADEQICIRVLQTCVVQSEGMRSADADVYTFA